MSMADVRVHRNSAKPAQLEAAAYTQGNHIHVGPGQEKHLPHEAWHVVQQKQGRVRATMQMKGKGINDSEGLEREADAMGERAGQAIVPPQQLHDGCSSGCGCSACAPGSGSLLSTQRTTALSSKNAASGRAVASTGAIESRGAIQLKCKHCNANSHTSSKCPTQATASEATDWSQATEAEITAEVNARHARMAATHHRNTGRRGTPAARREQWEEQNKADIRSRLLGGGSA